MSNTGQKVWPERSCISSEEEEEEACVTYKAVCQTSLESGLGVAAGGHRYC